MAPPQTARGDGIYSGRTALRDRPVPPCPRCGYVTRGWPLATVGDTYAGCPNCGKLLNR